MGTSAPEKGQDREGGEPPPPSGGSLGEGRMQTLSIQNIEGCARSTGGSP